MGFLANLGPLRRWTYIALIVAIIVAQILQYLSVLPALDGLVIFLVAVVSLFVAAFSDDDNARELAKLRKELEDAIRRVPKWRRRH